MKVRASMILAIAASLLIAGCGKGPASQVDAPLALGPPDGPVTKEQLAAARALSIASGGDMVGFDSEYARASACAVAVEAVRTLAKGRGVIDEAQDQSLQRAAAFYADTARQLSSGQAAASDLKAEAKPKSAAEARDQLRLGVNCLQTIEDFAHRQ